MSRRTRLILAGLGLLLVLFALAALSFAWGTDEVNRDLAPIAPTLFTLPPGSAP